MPKRGLEDEERLDCSGNLGRRARQSPQLELGARLRIQS